MEWEHEKGTERPGDGVSKQHRTQRMIWGGYDLEGASCHYTSHSEVNMLYLAATGEGDTINYSSCKLVRGAKFATDFIYFLFKFHHFTPWKVVIGFCVPWT